MILSIIGRGWRTVAVSEAGASHLKDDLPCQDACRLHVTPSTIIACVADGAGSAMHSAIGSRAAVNAFVSESANLLRRGCSPEDAICEAFQEARRMVSMVSEIAGDDLREYATTLLGVIATGNRAAAGQIGDGAIIIDGEVAVESHTGEYANETCFLTQHHVPPNIYAANKRVSRIALITDGLEHHAVELQGHARSAHGPFFDPFFRWLKKTDERDRTEQLSKFLRSDTVRSRTNDDVTLLLAMR